MLWRKTTLALAIIGASLPAAAQNVPTYHGSADRAGNFAMPGFTWERARALRLDPAFAPRFEGHLYAQPLYWKPPGGSAGRLIVASESNVVAAIDAGSGAIAWNRTLAQPAALSTLPCGNIDPLGITGTPAIDEASGTLYLDAVVNESGVHHRIYALSLNDGSVLPGWPIDVADALRGLGQAFDPRVQNQRGALLVLDRTLYVPFGGHFGDCGDYHGWVVGVRLDDPRRVSFWRTRGSGGGIWAPGGIASDGKSLYVATGNTVGANEWADGEAVFRLSPDLRHSEAKSDFFAMADSRAADTRDADLGGTNPLPFDLPGGQAVVLALGKDKKAYLLDPRNLGGIGGALSADQVATYPIRSAPRRPGFRPATTCLSLSKATGRDAPADPGGARIEASRRCASAASFRRRSIPPGAPDSTGPARRSSRRRTARPTRLSGSLAPRATTGCMASAAIPATGCTRASRSPGFAIFRR